MSSIWGKQIKISIFGESHGEAIGVTIDGIKSGEKIDFDYINKQMKRRAPARDETTSSRNEDDNVKILSGILNGYTTGSPICAIIKNINANSTDYDELDSIARPGHADYTAHIKYNGFQDVRGGGHFSGRLTAPLTFAGSICQQILMKKNIRIAAHIQSIKDIKDSKFNAINIPESLIDDLSSQNFPTIDKDIKIVMKNIIKNAKEKKDSVGGIIECAVIGIPAGIGNPMFNGIESCISSIVFGIPAVKGIEFGLGFGSSYVYGSNNNDEFYNNDGEIRTKTNNHGGILGGISYGMPIIFRLAIKPTPSIGIKQHTINLSNKINSTIEIKGRHDPCIVSRVVPVIEAATAISILELLYEDGKI